LKAKDAPGVDTIQSSNYLKRILMQTLIKSYCECEKLGGSHQFYEKFSYRMSIIQTVNFVKINDHYNQQFINFYDNHELLYVEMCTLTLNDE